MSNSVLELKNVSKTFGNTYALRDLSFDLQAGEIHAIVGENGAGKSTMIKIMTGVYHQDEGELLVDGISKSFSGPQLAKESGIVAIYQEPMVFPDLNVAENVFISSKKEGFFVKPNQQNKKASELVSRLGIDLDAERVAHGLTLAEQQAVEIARALSENVRVLIMDEPTASLSAHEASRLRRIARNLSEHGVAVIYISHRLEEIFEVADRVTVIRDGSHISTQSVNDVTPQQLIADMVGREVGNYFDKAASTATTEQALSAKNLTLTGVFEDINFELNKGEVLCFSGLVGARRTDVGLALFGVTPATSGTIEIFGKETNINNPKQAMDLGIAYVSEDRRKFGLAMPISISANISLATLSEFLGKFGFLNREKEKETANTFKEKLNIKTDDVNLPVNLLSGGNQQKTMLAKWLNLAPKILIFDEPTRGIDVGAKAEVHDLIRKFAESGGAVLVISSDLPEVLALGDRILVMKEGKQMGLLTSEKSSQEKIMALATGQEDLLSAA